jgi:photoactive yellow protein
MGRDVGIDMIHHLLDELAVGVVVLDRRGRVVHYNREEERLARRKRDQVLGRHFFDEIAPCMNVRELAGVFTASIGAAPIHTDIEFSFPFPFLDAPRDVTVQMRSFSVTDEPYAALFIEDVSPRRAVARMQRMLGDLLVHDMKNPLMIMQGAMDYARDAPGLPADVMEALSDGVEAGGQLQRMLLNLLDLTRLESAEMPVHRVQVDVRDCVAAAAAAARSQVRTGRHHAIAIEIDLPAEPLRLQVDRDLVSRAVTNLVENGLRFARRAVQVIARSRAEGCEIEVADDGPGIPADMRELIFDKYAQVRHAEVGDRGHNRGLGLTFVRLALRAHGGEVAIHDAPAGGTRFVLRLPAT